MNASIGDAVVVYLHAEEHHDDDGECYSCVGVMVEYMVKNLCHNFNKDIIAQRYKKKWNDARYASYYFSRRVIILAHTPLALSGRLLRWPK